MERPRFEKRASLDFYTAVKERVADYFKKEKISQHANREMIIKSALHIGAFLLLYALIVGNFAHGIYLLLAFCLMGLTQGLIGFNISHDALHGAYTSSPSLNRWIGYTFDFNGESSYVWKMTHNGWHHTFTNIAGHDQDINKAPWLRLSPHDPFYPIHRWQAIYIPILYGFVTLPWVFYGDYRLFYTAWKEGKVKKEEIPVFFFFKALNLILMLIIPLAVINQPVWLILMGYFLLHFCAGVVISTVFQLAHLVENVEFPLPDEQGRIGYEWAEHEMRTTSNFAAESRLLSYFMGGLNFQVEHHLFPHVCHVHYPRIRKIVKQTAAEFKIPYNEHETFFKALKSHLRLLHALGNPYPENSIIKSRDYN